VYKIIFKIFISISALFPIAVYSGTTNVMLLLAAGNQEDVYQGEYTSISNAAEKLDQMTASVVENYYVRKIVAQDGGLSPNHNRWLLANNTMEFGPIIDHDFMSKDAIAEVLKSDEFKGSDSTLMVIYGHAGRPKKGADGIAKPHLVSIPTWPKDNNAVTGRSARITLKELGGIIETASLGHPVRIVCLTCFSGGIHAISRNIPNVCTASTTSHLLPSPVGVPDFEFSKGFWNAMQESKKPIFAEAVISGLKNDPMNLSFGQLSSLDYIDYLFNRGPHNPDVRDITKAGVEIELNPLLEQMPDIDELIYQISDGVDTTKHPSAKNLGNPECASEAATVLTTPVLSLMGFLNCSFNLNKRKKIVLEFERKLRLIVSAP
jgi:hypothetical protein